MWSARPTAIDPVGVNLPAAGSYSSADLRLSAPSMKSAPPATRTRPSFSRVAVWPHRASVIDPVGLNLPVVGSYSSAAAVLELTLPVRALPPATRIRPFLSRVAVGPSRPTVIEPVRLN